MSCFKFGRILKRLSALVLFFTVFSPLAAQTDLINNTNDSGANSLRQAILDENASTASAATFAIGAPGSPQTNSPTSSLPVMTANNSSFLNNYNGQVILDGGGISGGTAILLNVQATGVSIQGLYFRNLSTTNSAIYLSVNQSLNMTDGDMINCSSGLGGVFLSAGSTFNLHITSNYVSQSATLGFAGNSTTNAGGGADLYLNSDSTAIINLDPGVTYGFYDSIGGTGTLSLQGPGMVVLDGNDLNFSGTVTMGNGANLEIGDINHSSAILNGGLTVTSGGTLSGTGTLEGDLVNNGTVYPGSVGVVPNVHVGTLTVGNYTQGPSGNLIINVLGDSNTQLQSVGAVTLAGSLQIGGSGPAAEVRRDYPVLISTQGLTGTLAGLSGSVTGFNPNLAYGADAVTLILTMVSPLEDPTQVSSIAPNELAVLTTLTQALPTAGPALVNKVQEIYDIRMGETTPAQQQAAADKILNSLAGPAYASNPQAMIFTQAAGQHSSLQAFQQGQGGEALLSSAIGWGGPALEATGPGTASSSGNFQGLWFDNDDSFGSTSGTANLQAFNQNNTGINAGYGFPLGDGLKGGLELGYLQSRSTASDGLSDTDLTGWQVGFYGTKKTGAVEWAAEGTFGIDHYKTLRTIAVGTDVSQAQGIFDGYQVGFSAQGGLPLNGGGLNLEPYIGAQWSRVALNSFTETGADPLDLSVASQTYDALSPFIGVGGARDFQIGKDLKLTPYANLTASYDLLDQTPGYQAAFSGAPNVNFTVMGNKPDPFLFGLEGGFQLSFFGKFMLFAGYNGSFNGSENLNTLKGGLNLSL